MTRHSRIGEATLSAGCCFNRRHYPLRDVCSVWLSLYSYMSTIGGHSFLLEFDFRKSFLLCRASGGLGDAHGKFTRVSLRTS